MYVGDTISLTNGTTMRSNLGTIEMVNGLHGGIAGLNSALFSFGLGAGGLGSNLGSLGGRFSVDVPLAPLLTNNEIAGNAVLARQSVQLAALAEKVISTTRDASADAGDVQIGDLTTVGEVVATSASNIATMTQDAAMSVPGVAVAAPAVSKNSKTIICDPKSNESCSAK
jgi:hypothetical protein